MWLIIELVKGENLNRVATNKSSPFTEPEIARVGRDILLGLKYLQDNNVFYFIFFFFFLVIILTTFTRSPIET